MRILTSANQPPFADTAVALGFFDGVHMGHRSVLRPVLDAAKTGLTPACFSFTTAANDHSHLCTEREKEQLLEAIGIEVFFRPAVSEIWNLTPEEFVKKILVDWFHAKFVCCGYDFTFGKDRAGSTEVLKALCEKEGIRVQVVQNVCRQGVSVHTTEIKNLLKSGDVESANAMLTYDYSFTGEVIRGNQIGRTLSFPTVNVAVPADKFAPKYGVYISETDVSGRRYASVSNVGVKPTVGGDTLLCETFLLGFDREIYGETVTVFLKKFVRPEQKFGSVTELRQKIAEAVEATEKFYKI